MSCNHETVPDAEKSMPLPCMQAMNGKNEPVITAELVEFEKLPLEVQDFQEITN